MGFINYVYVSSAFIGLRFGLLGFLKMKKTYGGGERPLALETISSVSRMPRVSSSGPSNILNRGVTALCPP
jgi:hypothetical protein